MLRGASLARRLLAQAAMSEPRRIMPETTSMLTRRCTQRQFLMRPDDEMNNAFLYCVIEAAQKFGISLILPQMMSTHHHTVEFLVLTTEVTESLPRGHAERALASRPDDRRSTARQRDQQSRGHSTAARRISRRRLDHGQGSVPRSPPLAERSVPQPRVQITRGSAIQLEPPQHATSPSVVTPQNVEPVERCTRRSNRRPGVGVGST